MKTIYKSILATLCMGTFFGVMYWMCLPGNEAYLIVFFVIAMVAITFGLFYITFSSGSSNDGPDKDD